MYIQIHAAIFAFSSRSLHKKRILWLV